MSHSKLNSQFPPQKFELIRNIIGAILRVELDHSILTDSTLRVTTITSRLTSLDKEELPAINITFAGSTPIAKDNDGVRCTCRYNIDVHTNSKDDEESALVIRDRLAGVVRYILDHPEYASLGYPPGFVASSTFTDIDASEPSNYSETEYVSTVRLVFEIEVVDENILTEAAIIDEALTRVKLCKKDKGYVYEYNNI